MDQKGAMSCRFPTHFVHKKIHFTRKVLLRDCMNKGSIPNAEKKSSSVQLHFL
ncbi:hypothetical protein D8674_035336 [Pyrus ussuriensis x Pyrus communis]|uniref:Uncharacterized protein n=1 Tax=Pyrus ussuriensis x Pyrus communis TaxID=2448454 RepID=A0A5N5GI76_9ROSA|nr:hypothetical protein D8674_035336 [Pyrus ussuriensis x Pyrus communis]